MANVAKSNSRKVFVKFTTFHHFTVLTTHSIPLSKNLQIAFLKAKSATSMALLPGKTNCRPEKKKRGATLCNLISRVPVLPQDQVLGASGTTIVGVGVERFWHF